GGAGRAAALGDCPTPWRPGDPAQIADLAGQIAAQESALHVLVNNAGTDRITSLEKLQVADLDVVWAVNGRAPVLLMHHLLPLLRAAGGASVINVTSVHDAVPHPQNFPYNMAKAALAMFTKSMAQELSPEGIRINNLAPARWKQTSTKTSWRRWATLTLTSGSRLDGWRRQMKCWVRRSSWPRMPRATSRGRRSMQMAAICKTWCAIAWNSEPER
ncbi:MAG: SDR family oxidoreductase, partial [Anaerolineae bacterium]|nr:SDR family oxidoreductase [Anaerolineae bacterium]